MIIGPIPCFERKKTRIASLSVFGTTSSVSFETCFPWSTIVVAVVAPDTCVDDGCCSLHSLANDGDSAGSRNHTRRSCVFKSERYEFFTANASTQKPHSCCTLVLLQNKATNATINSTLAFIRNTIVVGDGFRW